MISVIDMPPPEESAWWRGKRGFEVGFFPCEYVEVISGEAGGNGVAGVGGKSSTVPKGLSLAAATGRGEKGHSTEALVLLLLLLLLLWLQLL